MAGEKEEKSKSRAQEDGKQETAKGKCDPKRNCD